MRWKEDIVFKAIRTRSKSPSNVRIRILEANRQITDGQLCFEAARIDAKAECAVRAGDNGVAP